jgi:hypothetical protein
VAWTWDEIERDWLNGAVIALSPAEIIAAFETAERLLGRPWLDARRFRSNLLVQGSGPTLAVTSMGQRLAAIEGSAGSVDLVERIRAGERAAVAELTAAYFCVASTSEIEIGPIAQVKERSRKPDFRLRAKGDPWTYVEVTAPDVAPAHKRAAIVLGELMKLLPTFAHGVTVEAFLKTEPDDDQVKFISTEIEKAVVAGQTKDLPGLALIVVNEALPGQIVLDDHGESPPRPRVGSARAEVVNNQPSKHIAVRVPITDERAEAFITSEAKQLPTTEPGLIMIDMGQAPGGTRAWDPLIRRRLQPTLHTRVGAVGLFMSGIHGTEAGEAWIPEVVLIENSHARLPLPSWLLSRLESFAPRKRAAG